MRSETIKLIIDNKNLPQRVTADWVAFDDDGREVRDPRHHRDEMTYTGIINLPHQDDMLPEGQGALPPAQRSLHDSFWEVWVRSSPTTVELHNLADPRPAKLARRRGAWTVRLSSDDHQTIHEANPTADAYPADGDVPGRTPGVALTDVCEAAADRRDRVGRHRHPLTWESLEKFSRQYLEHDRTGKPVQIAEPDDIWSNGRGVVLEPHPVTTAVLVPMVVTAKLLTDAGINPQRVWGELPGIHIIGYDPYRRVQYDD